MRTELLGGPQDGLTLTVPPDCRELRFPVVLDPGFIQQFKKAMVNNSELTLPVSIYRWDGRRFVYAGQG